MEKKIWCFSTPTCAAAEAHPKQHYHWMLAGAELFHQLEMSYPIYMGGTLTADAPLCFETFPHAVMCASLGKIVSAKNKREERSALLEHLGIKLGPHPPIDFIDAAICALVATRLAIGEFEHYGDSDTGFIVVPSKKLM
jgi:hypothetical protein